MCLLNMQKKGQISGYYPDAPPMNQSSLCSTTVDNTRDDANAIWHFGKKTEPIFLEIITIRTF